jgi:hypothetical protein
MDPILTPAELDELRQEELSMMLDRCTLRRATGRKVQNESNGRQEPEYEILATDHRCQVRIGLAPGGSTVRTVEIGGVQHAVIEAGVKLPIDGPVLQRLDEIVLTDLGATTDPALQDAVLVVDGWSGATWATARRIDVVRR